ncbi:hypothetical protein G6F60_006497 [Rhizopus arrhizus]|uniref:Uncharacterized protein n=1 Tax=Rhizopus oryzae TaxID=64495 RepID=A0A9P6XC24_RHIOR|nr:hypothetical protein G6F64_004640 [Rhizopus arrhizus]KAG1401280.1 hypothetical protein G6F60_006497 [Rhizopus arrhizus]
MVDFISLIVEMVPLKDITSKTRMTLSTAYHFEKMWNKNEKVPEKKRNRAKKDVLKVERTLFTMKLADNFALMTLEQLRENLIEKFKETRKTYYSSSAKFSEQEKSHLNHG